LRCGPRPRRIGAPTRGHSGRSALPYLLFFTFFNVEWPKLEYEPPKEKSDWKAWRDWEAWKKWRPWRTWKTWALPLFFGSSLVWIVVTTSWPPQPNYMFSLTVILIWAWARLHRRMFPSLDGLGEELNAVYRKLIKFGPPFLALVFAWGMIQGNSDAKSVSEPYLVKFKDHERAEERVLLRNLDRGLLMRNAG
jgi:hypothetical protein